MMMADDDLSTEGGRELKGCRRYFQYSSTLPGCHSLSVTDNIDVNRLVPEAI
jgi:hypothetical protein